MSFLSSIQQRILLADGALYPILQRRVGHDACMALLNITRPMDVMDVHQAYLDAGADLLTANTFDANPLMLEHYGLQSRMEELIHSGVVLCKEAAAEQPRNVYVAASIGPTGKICSNDEALYTRIYDAFYAQCTAAEAAGADVLLIESMRDLREARLAILAARAASRLPILASFILEEDASTSGGNPPEVLALCCFKLGAAMAGINCGLGPQGLFQGYSRLAGTSSLPTFARPNAIAADGSDMPAHEMAAAMTPYLHAGVSMIGGCCGFTPSHVQALGTLLTQCSRQPWQSIDASEYICSAGKRLPFSPTEPYDLLSLEGRTWEEGVAAMRERAATDAILHISFANWTPEDITRLLFFATPHLPSTPLAFHLQTAAQAYAALFAYPGIAAVYAHADTYRVLKAAIRYGAEVVS